MGKNDLKKGLCLYFVELYHWFLQETDLNKNWYFSKFDWTGCSLGIMTRFWIFKNELFVIMNFFTITERNKNQWICQWICVTEIMWKLSYLVLLRIIAFELFEQWIMLIVLLFLVLILSRWLTIKSNNLRKLYSQISEKHD